MTPFFRNHFKIYKEDTYVNHFRHVLSSDQYLSTGGYIPQVFALGQFHVTTDTTQKNKSSYAEYLVLVLYCIHITCHGFKGNMQIQLNNSEISPFAQLCEIF